MTSRLVPILAVLGLIFSFVSLTAFFFNQGIINQPPSTAHATTDYLAMSCQQLKDAVNNHMNQESGVLYRSSYATSGDVLVTNFLQIMQMKGCHVASDGSVSP